MGKKTSLTYVELPKKYLAAYLKVLMNTFCVCYMDFMLSLSEIFSEISAEIFSEIFSVKNLVKISEKNFEKISEEIDF